MKTGKRICQTLKELRKRIADANDIPFEVEDCKHEGDCPGTCPKCETELWRLTNDIERREKEGMPVAVDGTMSEEELQQTFPLDSGEHGTTIRHEKELVAEEGVVHKAPRLPGCIHHITYNYDFASTIVKKLMADNSGNLLFSPSGLCRVLEMLREGMDVRSDVYSATTSLTEDFYSTIDTYGNKNFKLEHAASIWYNKTLGAIKKDFLKTLEDNYEAEAHNADFSQKIKTKKRIDNWVSRNTHKMITGLDTNISEDALMIILDAMYMHAKWENTFDADRTITDTFHNADNTASEVDMMHQVVEDADYTETEDYQVVSLPYKKDDYRMTVVLPKEGKDIGDVMSQTTWLHVEKDCCDVDLYMPRFKFANTISFKKALTDLGLGDMFHKDHSLPNMTDHAANVSTILQQSVIKVQENGTEAAAITMTECLEGCPPPVYMQKIVTVRLDRPFGFAIQGNNQLLFMGVVKYLNAENE